MKTTFVVVCYPGFRQSLHIMEDAEDVCIKHSPVVTSVVASYVLWLTAKG